MSQSAAQRMEQIASQQSYTIPTAHVSEFVNYSVEIVSTAWRSGLWCCFHDAHDCDVSGSTPTQAKLLRPWIRCFTKIISAWWNVANSKLKQVKLHRKTWKQNTTPKQVWIRRMYIAPPSLSCDKRIEMKKSSNAACSIV